MLGVGVGAGVDVGVGGVTFSVLTGNGLVLHMPIIEDVWVPFFRQYSPALQSVCVVHFPLLFTASPGMLLLKTVPAWMIFEHVTYAHVMSMYLKI